MVLSQKLDLRQTQTLVMTPQLQQAIKLLQMSNLELADYLEKEIERNPLLQTAEDSEQNAPDERTGPDRQNGETAVPDRVLETDELAKTDTYAKGSEPGLDNEGGEDAPGTWTAPVGTGGRRNFEESDYNLEQTLSEDVSLREHLTGQMNVDLTDPADRLIGQRLIDMLDEAGYLACDPAELTGVDVAHVLKRMQSFDPPGIFARNLRECLALQLTDSRQLDAKMAVLLNHLDLLAQHRIPELLTACGVKQDELVEMIGRIRRLDPKPAERFLNNAARTVVPDILMRAQADGSWFIELNSDTLPRVLINQHYFTTIKREARSRVERNYLTERYTAASWLIKSLHQRATTILKVAEEIIRRQDAFFAYGVQYLKPMTLRDVADTIGMHESTVSRVTTNKFIATPRGLFELKYFFTTAIADTDGGNTHSAESVRQRIKAMIDAETAETVISDEMIGKILKKDGIDIARRTVAKYREAMSIPSSVQRRRMKSMWSGSGM